MEHLTFYRKRQKQNFAREDVIMDCARFRVPSIQEHKHPGLIIDENLTWTSHIQAVYSGTAQRLGMLARLEKHLD